MIYAWLAGIAILIFICFGVVFMVMNDLKADQYRKSEEIKRLIKCLNLLRHQCIKQRQEGTFHRL